jgi:outer membrane receptor protein involved in Fe transport
MNTLRSAARARRTLAAFVASAVVVSAQTAAPATASADETIRLNPFSVTEGGTRGYMATNSISGTALNTPLRDVPMAINVITSEFLSDSLVGLDLVRAFDFNSSITQTQRQPVNNNNGSFAIRGFRNRNTLVDGVSAGEFVAPIMVDRIEVVKGPNAILSPTGSPGGTINNVSKKPLYVDPRHSVRVEYGAFDAGSVEFDSTGRIGDATGGKSREDYIRARDSEISAIESACQGDADDLRCEVVSLYQGGQYKLYRYRRHADLRLVFAPEFNAAFFGGDPDNFNFPRYALDAGQRINLERKREAAEAKLTAAREGLTKLSSGFSAMVSGARLAATQGRILTRLSRLRASAKVTPAEIKKMDLAKLAASGEAARRCVALQRNLNPSARCGMQLLGL